MIFVVHEHHAKNLHWDLRLEIDNVLKSWAIPKPIPLRKGIRRLAIMVDNHEKNYANFEGVIPEGYGAGIVKIWDKGTYKMIKHEDNKIIIEFYGKKLNGKYTLIRFKDNKWLMMKI